MTVISGFFNSIGDDRVYYAENFADYFASFIGNGVFPNPSTGLKVMAHNGLDVVVKPGKGWIFGYYIVNDADFVIELDNPDGVLKRIDRVVLRLDYVGRTIDIVAKKGTPASNPVPLGLTRNSEVYELGLADIYISNGQLTITNADITDLRLNSDLCGIVHGVVDQVDTTELYNQYESWYSQFTDDSEVAMGNWQTIMKSQFEYWVEGVQDILDETTAGNLLAMINAINNDTIRNPVRGRTTNVGNSYTIEDPRPLTEYVDDMLLIVTPNADSTGNVNIKVNSLPVTPVYRGNGMRFKDFYADSKVTLRYSTAKLGFIVQGEGGGGNAVASDILVGKTASTDAGDITGTMPNRGAVSITLNSGQTYTVTNGYHNGNGIVSVNTLASQTQATATASSLTLGKTAWVNGQQITGTIPNQPATTFTPKTTNQTIPAGRYTTGVQTILGAPTLISANIKSGVSIFGVTGTAPIAKHELTGSVNIAAGMTWKMKLPYNYDDNTIAVIKVHGYNAVGCAYSGTSGGVTRNRDELFDMEVELSDYVYDAGEYLTTPHIIVRNRTDSEHDFTYRIVY